MSSTTSVGGWVLHPFIVTMLGDQLEDVCEDIKEYESRHSAAYYVMRSLKLRPKDVHQLNNGKIFADDDSIDACEVDMDEDGFEEYLSKYVQSVEQPNKKNKKT